MSHTRTIGSRKISDTSNSDAYAPQRTLDLIRFGGHLPKGGYDVRNGRHTKPASAKSRRSRRRFTDEFKQQAVRLVLDEGKGVTAVARELDLVPSALGQWVKQAQADRSKGRTGLTTAEREELARLRKENRILQEERDILKKFTWAVAHPQSR